MNLYKFNLKSLYAVCILITLFSCQKSLDINENPNNSATASVDVVLPASQLGLSVALSRWNYLGCMWGQYWAGGPGVGTNGMEKYNMSSLDNNSAWVQAYSNALADMSYLTDSKEPIYAGIAKIMSAYLYQMLVDLHGDVPFSEAIKGSIDKGSILTPKFDSEVAVYNALIPLIDSGLVDIKKTGANILKPTTNDLIYNGDVSQWIKFANSLKLKILIRRGNYAEAKTLIETPGITFISNLAESAGVRSGATASGKSNSNPLWSQFDGGSLGMYYVAAGASINYLSSTGDPRINFVYFRPAAGGAHKGVNTGDVALDPQYALVGTETASDALKKYSSPGIPYNKFTPVYLITSWEVQFLIAEAYIRNGDYSIAEPFFNEGVQQSFGVLGASGASAYIAGLSFSTLTPDEMLNQIAIQKWISMNGYQMIEGWLETVRLERPGNEPFTSTDGIFTDPIQNNLGVRKYPSSFVYPNTEVSANPNTPAGRSITDKRFWDI